MTNIRRKFQSKMAKKQNKSEPIDGVIGSDAGLVDVPGRNNYVYVTTANGLMEVFNSRVIPRYGLPVKCGYDPIDPSRFQVVSISSGKMSEGSVAVQMSGIAPSKRYRWMAEGGGQDPLFVELRQFMPLRLGIVSGLTVCIYPGIMRSADGAWVQVDYQEIDLSAEVPVSDDDVVMVLVWLDSDGILNYTASAETTLADLTASTLPDPPDELQYAIAGVRLYSGITQLQEGRTNTDIVDLRFPMHHTHPVGDIGLDAFYTKTELQTSGESEVHWDNITNEPAVFPPDTHTHAESDITNLVRDLEHDAIKIGGVEVNLLGLADGDVLSYNSGGAEAKFDPVNLTKTASATPTNLFNNNLTDQWLDNSASHWLKFNFDYQAYVSKIVITANAGDWMWADYPDNIYIYASNSGDFTGEEVQIDHYAPGAGGVYTRTFAEPRTAYRYYKMTFGRPSHAVRINEIEIYTVPAEHRFENQQPVHDAAKIDGIAVDLTGITDGEVLVYEQSTNKFIPGEGGGGGGHEIQEDGSPLTQRSALNFTGDVELSDDAGNDATVVNVTATNHLFIDQSGGTSDTHGVLAGARNGVNTTFTVSQAAYITGALRIYLNGQLLTQGSGEDWVETTPGSGTFDFITAPVATDEITAVYGYLGVGVGVARRIETEIVLYRNPYHFVTGNGVTTTYIWPGDALSASVMRFRADMLTNASIIYAIWRGAWNPNAPGATVTGIRLVKADDGPSNIEVLATQEVGSTTSPVIWDIDVTTELQAMLTAGISKGLGHQIRGDGSNSPKIYASWIEIIWET